MAHKDYITAHGQSSSVKCFELPNLRDSKVQTFLATLISSERSMGSMRPAEPQTYGQDEQVSRVRVGFAHPLIEV